jgi:hypothetical protein
MATLATGAVAARAVDARAVDDCPGLEKIMLDTSWEVTEQRTDISINPHKVA